MSLKNFFIVGAQRSGSTYLYNVLDAHPEICMAKPYRPEPKFFLSENNFKQGKYFYLNSFFCSQTLETKILGEKSTSYIESRDAALRIKNYFTDAKIIFILRDPVARALSNYKFSLANGLETLSFKDAIQYEENRNAEYGKLNTSVSPFLYFKRGLYINYINMYAEIFEPSNIKILILEDFIENNSCVSDLYNWLGVNDCFTPEVVGQRVNYSDIETHVDLDTMRSLAVKYQQSVCDLEKYINRNLDCWRKAHDMLFD